MPKNISFGVCGVSQQLLANVQETHALLPYSEYFLFIFDPELCGCWLIFSGLNLSLNKEDHIESTTRLQSHGHSNRSSHGYCYGSKLLKLINRILTQEN